MISSTRFANVLADQALTELLIPWPCGSVFGRDGRYRLEEVVAATPHSLLYRATDLRLSSEGFDAPVAVKVARYRASIGFSEAALLRRVSHPNVLNVIDTGTVDDGLDFVVTEFVDGITLDDWVRPESDRDVVRLLVLIARGIQAAHTAGICHLDLKPSNVLLTGAGAPKIVDFGLASLETEGTGSGSGRRGNLAFMAPEQYHEAPTATAPPADIYALGGLLYWLLTGRLPNGCTEAEIAGFHSTGVPVRQPVADRSLEAIIARAMATVPGERHRSAGDLADDLEAWIERRPIAWQKPSHAQAAWLWVRRSPLLAALWCVGVVVVLGGTGVVWYVRDREQRLRLERETESRLIAQKEARTQTAIAEATTNFASGIGLMGAPKEIMVNSLVWLSWLHKINTIDDAGHFTPPKEVAQLARQIVEQNEATGQASSMETLLAKHTLAFLLLEVGEHRAAGEQLAQIRARWTGLVPATDGIWVQLQGLELCAEFLAAAPDSPERAHAGSRLVELTKGPEGPDPLPRLMRQVLRGSAAAEPASGS